MGARSHSPLVRYRRCVSVFVSHSYAPGFTPLVQRNRSKSGPRHFPTIWRWAGGGGRNLIYKQDIAKRGWRAEVERRNKKIRRTQRTEVLLQISPLVGNLCYRTKDFQHSDFWENHCGGSAARLFPSETTSGQETVCSRCPCNVKQTQPGSVPNATSHKSHDDKRKWK